MAGKKTSEETRVFDEIIKMACASQSHTLISRQDMVKMQLICRLPSQYTPENVTFIRVKMAKVSQSVFAIMLNVSASAVQKWQSPSSGKHCSGAATKLLQIIENRGLAAVVS